MRRAIGLKYRPIIEADDGAMSFLFHRKDRVTLMCERKVEKSLSYEIKCTSYKDAQLAERKLLLCSPLAREEFHKRNSFYCPDRDSVIE